jgi:hypothetical protein
MLVNIKLHLRPEEDDDLIGFFAATPPRRRARAVKAALRSGALPQAASADSPADEALTEALMEGGLLF